MYLFILRKIINKILYINYEHYLISRHNLIAHNMNHMKKRWKYRDVGESLVANFPLIHLEQSSKFKTKYVSGNSIFIFIFLQYLHNKSSINFVI